MPAEGELAICGTPPYRVFRKRNPDALTNCVLEPGHSDGHVYCAKIPGGIDEFSHALHYMQEVTRKKLKPVAIFEMCGPISETFEEIAALFQYMEFVNKLRKERENNGNHKT